MTNLGHNRTMMGAECIADMLQGYGVTHVFHVPAVLRKTFALMETRMEVMLAAIKTVRPAFDAFYGSLDAGQKTRLDGSGPRGWGWNWWRRQ